MTVVPPPPPSLRLNDNNDSNKVFRKDIERLLLVLISFAWCPFVAAGAIWAIGGADVYRVHLHESLHVCLATYSRCGPRVRPRARRGLEEEEVHLRRVGSICGMHWWRGGHAQLHDSSGAERTIETASMAGLW